MKLLLVFMWISVILCCSISVYSQQEDSTRAKLLNVYINCDYCYEDYIKTEITYVNYVRDGKQADVHILISQQQTGSRGQEYTLTFFGQKKFNNCNDTLVFFTKNDVTEEELRKTLVKNLKLGLVRYIIKTPAADKIQISYQEEKSNVIIDNWNNWVFSIDLNAWLNGEKSVKYTNLYGSLSARRVTEELKLAFYLSGSYYESNFSYADWTSSSFSRSQSFGANVVFSMGDHWASGAYVNTSSSTYSNIKFALNLAPAIEYNIFPYKESTRQQCRFLYRLNDNYFKYVTETIYGKIRENLFNQSLSVSFVAKQTWGTIGITLEGSHYLNDIKKNRLDLYGDISLRIIEGLSLRMYGSYSLVHDQLSLPKGELTTDEVLLQRRELESQYQYYTSLGISYTFGSIYNNIVNPRFGN